MPWDREQIHQLFDTLQFRVLRDRLYSELPNGIVAVAAAADGPATEAAQGFDVRSPGLGPDEVARLAGRARAEHASAAGLAGQRDLGPGHRRT